MKADPIAAVRRIGPRDLQTLCVAIAREEQPRRQPPRYCAGMAAESCCGVAVDSIRPNIQIVQALAQHHGIVLHTSRLLKSLLLERAHVLQQGSSGSLNLLFV